MPSACHALGSSAFSEVRVVRKDKGEFCLYHQSHHMIPRTNPGQSSFIFHQHLAHFSLWLPGGLYSRMFQMHASFEYLEASLAVQIQLLRPNHCSCTPSIIERTTQYWVSEARIDSSEIPKVGKRCWRTAGTSFLSLQISLPIDQTLLFPFFFYRFS